MKAITTGLNLITDSKNRKIEGWGLPKIYSNGTIDMSPGMVKDLAFGRADLIVTSFSIFYER